MKQFSLKDAEAIQRINSQIIAIRVACDFTNDEQRELNRGATSPIRNKMIRVRFYSREVKRIKRKAVKILGKEVAFMFFGYGSNFKTLNRMQRMYISYTAEHNPYTWVFNRISK